MLDSHRPHAQWAAEAARCAADQGMFWSYREMLFANQKKWTKGELKSYAEKLGMEPQAFSQCLDSGKHTEAVNQSTEEAKSLQLRGTPSYLINGRPIDLAQHQSVPAFMQKMQEEIQQAKGSE